MGWRLVAATFVIVGAAAAAIVAVYGTGESGIGLGLRVTARVSLALFVLTFIASSVNSLWKGPIGKALLRNRKYLGLSFAVSHTIHLGFIGARVFGHSDAFWAERTVPSLIPGTIAYVFLLAMIITSFPRPTKWLGRKKWKLLHKTGMYVLFAIFTAASAKNLRGGDPIYVIHLSVLASALALRAVARYRRRR